MKHYLTKIKIHVKQNMQIRDYLLEEITESKNPAATYYKEATMAKILENKQKNLGKYQENS